MYFSFLHRIEFFTNACLYSFFSNLKVVAVTAARTHDMVRAQIDLCDLEEAGVKILADFFDITLELWIVIECQLRHFIHIA